MLIRFAAFAAFLLPFPLAKSLAQVPGPGLTAEECKIIDIDSMDDRPTFTLDGKTMFFGSRRFSRDPWRVPDPNPQWKWDSDIWYRVWLDSVWSEARNLGQPVNNSGGQINPTVNPRGDMIYYVTGDLGQAFLRAKLVNDKPQNPSPVPGQINSIYWLKAQSQGRFRDSVRYVAQQEMLPDSDLKKRAPEAWDMHLNETLLRHLKTEGAVDFFLGLLRGESTIMPDGKFVIISENFGQSGHYSTGHYGMAGAGDEDLWIAPIDENGGWDSLNNLTQLNTPYAETYPFMAADGETLYFTSNRPCLTCPPTETGGQDIYMTRWTGKGWSEPKPLGAPFNSPRDDYGFSIGPDGETAYFVSNRSGKSRLYQVHLRPQDSTLAPKQVYVVEGRITNAKTGAPLRAEVFVDDLSAEQNKFSVISDSLTGNYVLALQRGHRFGLQVVKANYLPHSERFTVPKLGAFDQTRLDIALAPNVVGSEAEFKNVYFDFGKWALLDESKLELDRVVEFLKQSPGTEIRIEGHTDDVGSDQTNQHVSEERAKAVLQYLEHHGIAKRRMTAIGYGKTKPRVQGTDDASRAQNRRVEMVVTVVSK